MKWPFLFFSVFFLGLFSGSCHAAAPDLVVRGTTFLNDQSRPYTFASITVEEDGQLVIGAGVTISLLASGQVQVRGSLKSQGTAGRGVTFTSAEEWAGLNVSASAKEASFAYTEFAHFTGPLSVSNSNFSFSHCQFTDGRENQVRITVPEGKSLPPLFLSDLAFNNRLLGKNMRSEGVELDGSFSSLTFSRLSFNDRLATEASPSFIGIKVVGSRGTLTALGTSFAGICPPGIGKVTPTYAEIVPNSAQCDWNKVPVLFVPGYGTSVNLKKLERAETGLPELDGWRFLNFFTPAYTYFSKALESNHIPYGVAYYDWRLPAEQAAVQYLEPALNALKQKTGVPLVHIVAHSFGGLVARSYIQGTDYQGDVSQLVELGTPNLGAAKAYSIWEAGELPADWQSFNHLLRLYSYQRQPAVLSNQTIIHTFFPSARELLPIYPTLLYKQVFQNPTHFTYNNLFGLQLEQNNSVLFQRTKVTSVFSTDQPTLETIVTTKPPGGSQVLWPDGPPNVLQPDLQKAGDGTVPVQSAVLPAAARLQVTGSHADLPQAAAQKVVSLLYPQKKYISPEEKARQNAFHWFVFDCPIAVSITLPDGSVQTSENSEGPGEIETGNAMLWLLVPDLPGKYRVSITAKADTEVRYWVDGGLIHTSLFTEGQQTSFEYEPGSQPSPPPLPTVPSPSATTSFSFPFSPAAMLISALTSAPTLPLAYIPAPFQQAARVSKKSVFVLHKNYRRVGAVTLAGLLLLAVILLLRRRE